MQRIQPVVRVAALAAGLGFAALSAHAANEESGTVKTNPGFEASGKINPGKTEQAPSSSTEIRKLPSPEEARAAVMMPDPKDPAPGKPTTAASGEAGGGTGEKKEANDAIGGPLTPGGSAGTGSNNSQSASGSGSGTPAGQDQGQSTTGLASPESANWPIGSTGQTAPGKFSKRNEILDRVPMMAIPMQLSDQDRRRIFDSVMAEKVEPAADASGLQPASQLTTELAFNDMRPLPQSLADIEWIKNLDYVKAKDKVLLVEPATRTVVEMITR